MRQWQVIVAVVLMAAAGWAIVLYPPGERSFTLHAVVTPVPTPTVEPAQSRVSLLFAGDVMLSRSVGDLMARRSDWTWPFGLIASVTREADVMFANLESVIAERGVQGGCTYCFRADPNAVEGLQYAGIDVVSLANNHAWDFGITAVEDSLIYLASGQIDVVGAGRTIADAAGPLVRTVRGTRIAYLAYTDLLPAGTEPGEHRAGINRYDPVRMRDAIAGARLVADVVVVSFHTGTEYAPLHSAHQELIYRAAIDAGADLVVGHHPHVVQDFERYKDGWIFYSLGNFVFDQNWSAETRKGALLSVLIEQGAIASASLIPVDISTQYRASVAP